MFEQWIIVPFACMQARRGYGSVVELAGGPREFVFLLMEVATGLEQRALSYVTKSLNEYPGVTSGE